MLLLVDAYTLTTSSTDKNVAKGGFEPLWIASPARDPAQTNPQHFLLLLFGKFFFIHVILLMKFSLFPT